MDSIINGNIDFIRGMKTIPNNTDLNNVIDIGMYGLPRANTYTNKPNGTIDFLMVMRDSITTATVWQMGFYDAGIHLRVRSTSSSSSWTNWKSVSLS